MKTILFFQNKFKLFVTIIISFCFVQISCEREEFAGSKVDIHFQIPLPSINNLKSATATTVQSVVLTVTSENEVLVSKELTVNGNTASGTISILPGENRVFTAEAIDNNGVIQWQGSTTQDIIETFTVNIELNPVLPSQNNLLGESVERLAKLTWNQNSDQDFYSYKIFRSQSDTLLGSLISEFTSRSIISFSDSTVFEGKTYYYTLVITDTEGLEVTTKVVEITIPIIPPDASILHVKLENNSAVLNWSINQNDDFFRYDLYRSESEDILGEIVYSTPTNTDTVYTDTETEEGSTYFYRIIVIDNEGFNTRSNVVQIGIPLTPPLPVQLSGKYENRMNKLTWTQSADEDFAKYELYRSDSESVQGNVIYSSTNVTDLNFNDDQIGEGTKYFYSLIVIDNKSLESKSNVINIEIPNLPPTKPVLFATYNNGKVILNWSENQDSDFFRYDLYRSNSESALGIVIHNTMAANDTSYTDNEVNEGESYFYRVAVIDNEGTSVRSDVVEINIPIDYPTASTLNGVEDDIVYLSWSQNPDSNFERYELYKSENKDVLGEVIYLTNEKNNLTFEDTHTEEGKTYYYSLLVINTNGYFAQSNKVQINMPVIPPSYSELYGWNEGIYVYLNWDKNEDDDFEKYELYRSDNAESLGTQIFSTTDREETQFENFPVSEGENYHYKLVVFDVHGNFTTSNNVEINIPNYPPTASTLNLDSISYNYNISTFEIKLSWTRNTDLDFGRYELYRSFSSSQRGNLIYSANNRGAIRFQDNLIEGEYSTVFYTIVVFDLLESSAASAPYQVKLDNYDY